MEKSPRPIWTVVGKKIVMAVTGLLLCLFLVGHLAGNLLLLMNVPGRPHYWAFNTYANVLDAVPILPIIEIGLLLMFLLHAYDGLILTLQNKNARPEGYYKKEWSRKKSDKSRKSVSSSTMMWTGTVILVFVALHVWHFKYNHPVASPPLGPEHAAAVANSSIGGTGVGAATTMPGESGEAAEGLATLVVNEFQNPIVSGLYVICMLVLGLHLYHAVSSSFQSLGVSNPRLGKPIIWFGKLFTIVIAGGFAFLPLWVYLFIHPGGRP